MHEVNMFVWSSELAQSSLSYLIRAGPIVLITDISNSKFLRTLLPCIHSPFHVAAHDRVQTFC